MEGYTSFIIPGDVGGRFSVFTPVGLLPLAVAGVDIEKFVEGARAFYKEFQKNSMEENIAYQYAAYRYHQYKEIGKNVEVKLFDKIINGIAVDIDEDGELVVSTEDTIYKLYSGEITKLSICDE
mgnify:CR=1 FL=1